VGWLSNFVPPFVYLHPICTVKVILKMGYKKIDNTPAGDFGCGGAVQPMGVIGLEANDIGAFILLPQQWQKSVADGGGAIVTVEARRLC
jgi:hypothetical protein